MKNITVVLVLPLATALFPVDAHAVTRQLCPMVEINLDLDEAWQLEDVEIIFRCQETFPLDWPGFGKIRFKPDLLGEHHVLDADDERYERQLEWVFEPAFDCPWSVSVLHETRRFPRKRRSDRDRWAFSLMQGCIPFLPDQWKHEERRFPHDPEDHRVEDEFIIEAKGNIGPEMALKRRFFFEHQRFPKDPKDDRLRWVSSVEPSLSFCSKSVKGRFDLERWQYPNDPVRDRWELEPSMDLTCDFRGITLRGEASWETRRFPNAPRQDWDIRKLRLTAKTLWRDVDFEVQAYWQRYRRPNFPSSSTNRTQFWLRFIGERRDERAGRNLKITTEWRWRDVPVKRENDRLIKILEVQVIQESAPPLALLFDVRLEDVDHPNDPKDDELDVRILAGVRLDF